MNKWDFYQMPKILFGAGRIKELPQILPGMGKKPLIVHYGEPIPDVLPPFANSADYHPKSEPRYDALDQVAYFNRSNGVDYIIGIGGGSVLDAAKALAGLIPNPGSCLDYLEVVGKGLKLPKPALPWIAIPTTAGTGSEVTRNAVIAVPEKQFKASLRGEGLVPRYAIIDPELQVNVPPSVTAASGLDALCQCIEAYVSKNANPMTDPLALEGIRRISKSLYKAYLCPTDIDARGEMAFGALLSGIALSNAGLGVVHGFAAPIGAAFKAPHGVVCGRLLPNAIKANIISASNQNLTGVLDRFKAVGLAMGCPPGNDPLQYSWTQCEKLRDEMKLPALTHYGLNQGRFQEMIELAKQGNSIKYNPVVLNDEELRSVLSP